LTKQGRAMLRVARPLSNYESGEIVLIQDGVAVAASGNSDFDDLPDGSLGDESTSRIMIHTYPPELQSLRSGDQVDISGNDFNTISPSEGMANHANEHHPLSETQRTELIGGVADHLHSIMELMGIDLIADHNSEDSPLRIAKAWVNEIMGGRFGEAPNITTFPNHRNNRQMILSGPIRVTSLCSHHWSPFIGEAYVAYIPGTEVIGLSKLSRVVDFYARRPQIQEELTQQIADHLMESLPSAWGVAVMIRSQHQCMTCRGVKDTAALMTTSDLRGAFMNNLGARQEFFDLCRDSKV